VRHTIHNLIAFYEMKAPAAHALLGHAQKASEGFDREIDRARAQEGPAQVLGNPGLHAEGPTWQEIMDREIAGAEARLQRRA
jgi:hypothetical protein